MGLRSPFGYVDYEFRMASILVQLMDTLCSHCHTNKDYEGGCSGCPAGVLILACKEYLKKGGWDDDERMSHYAERAEAAGKPNESSRRMAEDYKPECDILRSMRVKLKRIRPHPFYYVMKGKRWVRPKVLEDFMNLAIDYQVAKTKRLSKWGLPGCSLDARSDD